MRKTRVMDAHSQDQLRAYLYARLAAIADAAPAGEFGRETVVRDGRAWTLSVAPAGFPPPTAGSPRLKPTARDILLTLLELHPRRVTAEELHREMVGRNRDCGLSTVKQNIPDLARAGLVYNWYDQCGYGLTDAGLTLARGLIQRPA